MRIFVAIFSLNHRSRIAQVAAVTNQTRILKTIRLNVRSFATVFSCNRMDNARDEHYKIDGNVRAHFIRR